MDLFVFSCFLKLFLPLPDTEVTLGVNVNLLNINSEYNMFTVVKRMEVSASHSLKLSYQSKCENLHGHNWIVTVYAVREC